MEELSIANMMELFSLEGPEFEFIKEQIIFEGLTNFHLTIKRGLSDERKRELIRHAIETWDTGTEIKEI